MYARMCGVHISGWVPYWDVWSENIHRADGESQGNISFGTGRKIRAGPVVIAPYWGTALFALTTTSSLNGGPWLRQKPEQTNGGEERGFLVGLYSLHVLYVCISFSAYPCVLSGRNAITDPMIASVGVCVCVCVDLCTCACTCERCILEVSIKSFLNFILLEKN